jgi:hypothetical protein
MSDLHTGRHLAIIWKRKEVKKLPYHACQRASYHIKDKLERVKKETRLLTTE